MECDEDPVTVTTPCLAISSAIEGKEEKEAFHPSGTLLNPINASKMLRGEWGMRFLPSWNVLDSHPIRSNV